MKTGMNLFLFKTILTNKVFLVQTDTTVGFLSQDASSLAKIKERSLDKPFVQVCASFKTLKKISRIPIKNKNLVRRSKKITFVYPNDKAVRVIKESSHADFIKENEWFYSTSANENTLSYNENFAFNKSDIIVEDIRGLYEGKSSEIYRLTKKNVERLR